MKVSVSGSMGESEEGKFIIISLGHENFVLNIWVPITDLCLFDKVSSASWEDGGLRIGTSADSSAFWSIDDGKLFIGIGHDNQTWDFSLNLPDANVLLEEIISEMKREIEYAGWNEHK
ncbi:hypothetical protein ACJJIU_13225 [Microbulbifer sp. CnH-101-E]|uniref:hypothetical protein n=1 Tax=unclassified Microbulbifer TaxID=2619833 RepID=UPI004039D54E